MMIPKLKRKGVNVRIWASSNDALSELAQQLGDTKVRIMHYLIISAVKQYETEGKIGYHATDYHIRGNNGG